MSIRWWWHGALGAALLILPGCVTDESGAGDVLVTAEVVIDPPGAGLRVGSTQRLTATPRTSSGIAIPNRPVTWASADPDIATVSDEGLVTAVRYGSTDITATVDAVTGIAPVNVSQRPVAQVQLEPASVSLQVGQQRQLEATARTEDGSTVSGRSIAFSSDAPTIATVSSGLVTAVGPGQTVVRARVEGKEGRSTITVAARPAVRVGFITHPADGMVDRVLDTISVAVQDELGTTVSTAGHQTTLSLSDNSGGARLLGTITVGAEGGVATFTDLRIDRPGTYALRATAGSLSPALSNPFSIESDNDQPALTLLVLVVQPSSSVESGEEFEDQPVIQLRDAAGRNVERSGVRVRVTLTGPGSGKLEGDKEVSTDREGRARFRDLRIKGTGDFRLRFEANGMAPVESNLIRVGGDDDDDDDE